MHAINDCIGYHTLNLLLAHFGNGLQGSLCNVCMPSFARLLGIFLSHRSKLLGSLLKTMPTRSF